MDFLIIYALYAVIMAAQGWVVFATARFIRRQAGGRRWQSKVLTIVASYAGWTILSVGGVIILGLVGGLMEGLVLVAFLWFTATIATLIYLLVWLLRKPNGAEA